MFIVSYSLKRHVILLLKIQGCLMEENNILNELFPKCWMLVSVNQKKSTQE